MRGNNCTNRDWLLHMMCIWSWLYISVCEAVAIPRGDNPPQLKVTSYWADTVIGLSYFAIPVVLAFFVTRLPSTTVEQKTTGFLFVCFIMFCGIGHLLDASSASAKYVLVDRYLTAGVSALTASLSPFVFRRVLHSILLFHKDRRLMEKQRDMLADAQAMTQLGNWELRTSVLPAIPPTNKHGDGYEAVVDVEEVEDVVDIDGEHDPNSSETIYIEASDEWFRIFGISRANVENNTIPLSRYMALLNTDDTLPIQRAIDGAFEGTPYTIIQRARREDDGKEIYIRGYGKPLFSQEKPATVIGLRGTAQDITAEIVTQNELRNAKEVAIVESKHKDIFLATMSHELRTPLTSIIGHVDLLEETTLDDLQQEYAGNAKRAATTLLSLINDILDYSKLIAGVVDLEVRTLSLSDVLRDILAIVKDLGKDVTVRIHPYNGPLLLGDAVRVKQILLNLVSNATKFTMPGGFVTVTNHQRSLSSSLCEVTFQVRDTGIGMSENAVAHLFQPFRQADSSTNRRFGGTGLGLSIVKKLIDAMGGKIQVDSQEGAGTTFTVTLSFNTADISPEPADAPDESNKKGRHAPQKRLRILLAEDNKVTQKLVQRMLQEHNVDLADNGRIAADMVRDNAPYDLMFCDVNMPIMDGLEATREIRGMEKGKGLYIIGLTANAFKTDRENCIAAGMNSYLSKPFSKQVLISMLERKPE